MSWYHDKVVVPNVPVVTKLSGNVTVASCRGIVRVLLPTETWEDYFVYQQNNYSGKLWEEEAYDNKRLTDKVIHKVMSSNGKSFYNVTQVGDSFVCNCVGFSYRRNCRHCAEVKSKLKG